MKIEVLENNIRLDNYLIDKLDSSRSKIQKLIKNNSILVNDKNTKSSYLVKTGDIITITDVKEESSNIEPEDIKLDIVYEDEYLLVVNKPSGMVVHPGCGNRNHTLVNALMHHSKLSNLDNIRPGIVHRIDAYTSGLLMVAKDDKTHRELALELKSNKAKRKYLALVHGVIVEDTATIDAPIGRDTKNRKKMCVTSVNSKDAITHIKVLERYIDTTFIECTLETGRTHQIRVHLSYINHPIVNDSVYGHKKQINPTFGQMLHAYTLGFIHPVTHEYLEFKAEPPKEFMEILNHYKTNS
ncbi:pseudouridine synthase [Clostridium sp. CAG:762]|mgnify:FL=1|jgi:23S rRNA pseudouridine1911/1915/1917 synthase|nr:pseudouridine synthase [Clostridium sp. CAG:762]